MRCVAFSADGKTLATGTDFGDLKLWDVAAGKERFALPYQLDYVITVAFTKDGTTLVSTTGDGVVKCWDALKMLERKADK